MFSKHPLPLGLSIGLNLLKTKFQAGQASQKGIFFLLTSSQSQANQVGQIVRPFTTQQIAVIKCADSWRKENLKCTGKECTHQFMFTSSRSNEQRQRSLLFIPTAKMSVSKSDDNQTQTTTPMEEDKGIVIDKKCDKYVSTNSKQNDQSGECNKEQDDETAFVTTHPRSTSFSTTDQNETRPTLSKRAQKRLLRSQRHKKIKKQKKANNLWMAQNDDAGYKDNDFDQSSYYFENGLRKVRPYNYVFSTFAKGRWIGRKLSDILGKEFGYDHPDELTNAFKLGKIFVNNDQASEDYVVKDCDYISHRTHRHENSVTAAPIEILHDSEDVIVINKPSSIPCHPCGRYRFNSVVFILGKEMGYPNLRNIYRLDRLTSGVLVLGKTAGSTKLLEDQVVNRQVQKEYVCRVVGRFPDGKVEVDQPLKALSNKLRLQIVSRDGKESHTVFERISFNGTSSVVKCWPTTGRTHQIRVHLQFLGHPIINDGFYNNEAWGPNKGKGGLYGISFQEVCDRILREHNVNLWDGGENPMYKEKLQQQRLSEKLEVTASGKAGRDSEPLAKKLKMEGDNDISSSDKNKVDVENTDEGTKSVCESKKKDNIRQTMNSSDSVSDSVKERIQQATNSSDSAPNTKNVGDNSTSITCFAESCSQKDNLASDFVSTDVSSSSLPSSCAMNESPPPTADLQTVSGGNRSQPQREDVTNGMRDLDKNTCKNLTDFAKSDCKDLADKNDVRDLNSNPSDQWSEWENLDLNCELCKKKALDPPPKHLVMFLCALKYKGPGWEYGCPLPDWAHEDWNKEDDFLL